MRRRDRLALLLAALAGAALCLIGLRFLLWPEAAIRFFGLGPRPLSGELSAVVAFRDVWLGALALGLVAWREWRALALWLGLGAMVCFADAALVVTAGGKVPAVLFHVLSGLACAVIATWCVRR